MTLIQFPSTGIPDDAEEMYEDHRNAYAEGDYTYPEDDEFDEIRRFNEF